MKVYVKHWDMYRGTWLSLGTVVDPTTTKKVVGKYRDGDVAVHTLGRAEWFSPAELDPVRVQ
jgi:hypothetical protein